MGLGGALLALPPTRWALLRWALPKPGEGPGEELRRKGCELGRASSGPGRCAGLRVRLRRPSMKHHSTPTPSPADFHASIHAVGEPRPGDDLPPPVCVSHVRSGDGGDPGYRCTARMCVEAALTASLERDKCAAEGGVLTPASGLGMALVHRLNKSGMELSVD